MSLSETNGVIFKLLLTKLVIHLSILRCYEPKFCRVFSSAAGADQEQGTWYSGWFAWCPTSDRLLEIAESQILRSKIEFLVHIF